MQLLTNASAASYQSTFIIWQIHMQLLNNLYADSDKLKAASNKVNEASDKSTCRFRKFIYNFRWIHGWAWILDRVGLLGGGGLGYSAIVTENTAQLHLQFGSYHYQSHVNQPFRSTSRSRLDENGAGV